MSNIQVIQHKFKNFPFYQRTQDGYLNATALVKASNKVISDFLGNARTRKLIEAIASELGISSSEVVHVIKGGGPKLQGTWIHPYLAVHFAAWCSPEFAVKVSEIVIGYYSGKFQTQPEESQTPINIKSCIEDLKTADSLIEILLKTMDVCDMNKATTIHLKRQIHAIRQYQTRAYRSIEGSFGSYALNVIEEGLPVYLDKNPILEGK